MATRAAATRSLPRVLYRYLPASRCLVTEYRRFVTRCFTRATTEADGGKGNTMRIYGPSPPKKITPYEKKQKFLQGYVPSLAFVSETKYTSSLFDGLHRDFSPKPDIFILHKDNNDCQYFGAHSVNSDGTISISPKYYIYPPKKDFFFASSSCNGLLHFQNGKHENLAWNPATDEFKMFPKRFDPPPPLVVNYYSGCALWCDPSYEDCKVLQVVTAVKEDEEGEYDSSSYHMELYSLKTNSCKKIECAGEFSWVSMSGRCINGVYYCQANREGEEEMYKGLFAYIISFVPETGPWEYVLWVLENASWRKESVFHSYGVYNPLWFSENGNLLYFSCFDDEIVLFDRATGKLEHLGVYSHSGTINPVPVSKSFVRLDEISDVGVHIQKKEKGKEEEEDVEEEGDDEYGPLVVA
ncbi:hypothetical protein OROGR_008638 [Orobanche gracilis]